jgi:hypothetical protein
VVGGGFGVGGDPKGGETDGHREIDMYFDWDGWLQFLVKGLCF